VTSGRVQADAIRTFATAAGLFGIGHGIHTGSKHFAKRTTADQARTSGGPG
jgi:hypothetical protein